MIMKSARTSQVPFFVSRIDEGKLKPGCKAGSRRNPRGCDQAKTDIICEAGVERDKTTIGSNICRA